MVILSTLLYIVFVLSAIVLVVVILLQEGKGGGLTGALGTEGQQTFGVGARGINRFTGWTCALFLAAALGIHWVNRHEVGSSVVQEDSVVPLETGNPGAQTPPAEGGGQTPPANGGGQAPANPGEQPK